MSSSGLGGYGLNNYDISGNKQEATTTPPLGQCDGHNTKYTSFQNIVNQHTTGSIYHTFLTNNPFPNKKSTEISPSLNQEQIEKLTSSLKKVYIKQQPEEIDKAIKITQDFLKIGIKFDEILEMLNGNFKVERVDNHLINTIGQNALYARLKAFELYKRSGIPVSEIEKIISTQKSEGNKISDFNNYAETLAELGKKFYEEFKDRNIIAIGASPEWIVHSAKEYAKAIGDESFSMKIKDIAFSGSYCSTSWIEGGLDTREWKIIEGKNVNIGITNVIINNKNNKNYKLSVDDIKNYHYYLLKNGINLKDIMERFNENKEETILFDEIVSGGCILSFIHVLKECCKLEGIKWNPEAIKLVSFSRPNEEFHKVENEETTYDITLFPIEEELEKCLMENSQRKIPPYRNILWKYPQYIETATREINNDPEIAEIKQNIATAAQKIAQQSLISQS